MSAATAPATVTSAVPGGSVATTVPAGAPITIAAPPPGAPLSYVPPASGLEVQSIQAPGITPIELPPPPPSLTEGIPDPRAIEQQKAAYAKGLDDQLRQGAAILNQQLKQQMDQLYELGDRQKKQYFLQVDHEIKTQELGLVQQFKEQLLLVQQAAQQQKRVLKQQATSLLLDYHQKKAQEELLEHEYVISKQAFDHHVQHQKDMSMLQQQQTQARELAVQQQAAVEQHAVAAMQAVEAQRLQVAQQMAAQSKLVQSAEMTAAAATNMYASPAPSYMPPPVASYVPAPENGAVTTMTPSYQMAPVTMAPTVSNRALENGTPTITYAAQPATVTSYGLPLTSAVTS